MTDPTFELYTCFINLICGLFFFIIYYGVLLYETNKNKYLVYTLDFISIICLGILYLFILDANKITFHIYFIIFIILGYILGLRLFNKQLFKSYLTSAIIFSYIIKKIKIILKWSFDIIPIKIIKTKIKKQIFKYKLKKFIKKTNKKILQKEE